MNTEQHGSTTTTVKAPHIRWMIRRDMPEVLAIEQGAFEYPWSESDFLATLRRRNSIGMVAERRDAIVGFMVYELHKTRLHVLNFAVHEACLLQGVGGALVEKLRSKLSRGRRVRISLEVRETNLPAQRFFAAHGFRALRVLRDFYDESAEDAYLFELRHPSLDEPRRKRRPRTAG